MEYTMNGNISERTGSGQCSHTDGLTGRPHGLIASLVLTVTLIAVWGPSLSFADQASASVVPVGMQSGSVTATHEHAVVIDGREYGFSPKIVVLDHEGNETELAYITTKSKVHFRLMKDEIQKIERVIVYHPE